MDVLAEPGVVEQVPPGVIWIVVGHELVGTVPAPGGRDGPLSGRDLEREPAGQPDPTGAEIHPGQPEAMVWSCLGKRARERVVEMEARVIGRGVSVPMVATDVTGRRRLPDLLPTPGRHQGGPSHGCPRGAPTPVILTLSHIECREAGRVDASWMRAPTSALPHP